MADSSSVVPSGVQSSVTNGDGQIVEEKESIDEEVPVNLPRKSSVLKKDGRPSKRSLQKSVSFIARPEDKRIINGEMLSIFLQTFVMLVTRETQMINLSFFVCSGRLFDLHAEWFRAHENPLKFTTIPEVLFSGRRPFGIALAALFQETRQSKK